MYVGCCDIVIYKKYIYICSSSSFLVQRSSNPWAFLRIANDKGVLCYVNEANLGKHLNMGLIAYKVNHGIKRLEFFSQSLTAKSREGLKIQLSDQWSMI